MDHQKSQTEANFAFFRGLYENSELWSCVGYDGLSLAFGLPIEDVRSLTDDQKHSLLDLLSSLAKMRDESLTVRVRALESLPVDERLTGLIALSTRV
jgi:hypothetical protein